jgi:alkyl sulfatase BDS1-like metallo-beta-lactamase superfamily hydrolase
MLTDLIKTMMGAVSFDEQITSGKAKFVGNRDVYEQLKSMLVHFDLGFEPSSKKNWVEPTGVNQVANR